MKSERKSDVTVEVFDLTPIMDRALAYANEKLPLGSDEYTAVTVYGGDHARGVDSEGNVFILNHEGVGHGEPLSDDNPAHLDFHAHSEDSEGNRTGSTMFPVAAAAMRPADFEDLPVKETVNLADFIRSFGSRLENNFDAWNRVLSK